MLVCHYFRIDAGKPEMQHPPPHCHTRRLAATPEEAVSAEPTAFAVAATYGSECPAQRFIRNQRGNALRR